MIYTNNMNKEKLNIAFAGGGSGGHIMPISSLIKYIYKNQKYSDQVENIFWFGQKWQIEEKEFDKLSKSVGTMLMSSDNINISKAKEKDAEDITKFRLEFWYDVYSKIVPWLTMQWVKNRLLSQTSKYIDEIKKQIINENNIYIIKDENILVWYFKPWWYYGDGINAWSIYILSKYQHLWIWSKLIKKFLSDNKDKNIYCEIAKNNKQSIDFCLKNWFVKYKQWGNYEYIDWNSIVYIDCNIYKLNKSDNSSSLNDKESDKTSLVPTIFIPIFSGKFRRQPNFMEVLQNISDILKFLIWIFQSLRYIYKSQIDVVFCKWWYVALPVVIAAKILGRKIIVHESDTKSWLVNKIAAKFADKVYTWFEWVLAAEQIIGQIISDDIIPPTPLFKGDWMPLNWDSQKLPLIKGVGEAGGIKKMTILVNLGSLGSADVHDAILYIFEEYPDLLVKYERHIILGSLNANYEKKYKTQIDNINYITIQWKNERWKTYYNISNNINIYAFVDQKKMWELLYICDISICRGGTTTLAEQKLFGLKQLIVPIPRTHDQSKNAKYYQDKFDDIYINQDKITNILGNNIYNKIVWLKEFRKNEVNLEDIRSKIIIAKEIICNELIK